METKKTNTITIYRADDYYNNGGTIVGFFYEKEDAESLIDCRNPVPQAEGNFSLITEFIVEESRMKNVDINDNKTMLSQEIWGDGIIIADYYYI